MPENLISNNDVVIGANEPIRPGGSVDDSGGDIILRTSGVERARIKADGTGSGWPSILGGDSSHPAVTNGAALIPLQALIADAANRVVNIGFYGDSVTVGKYANGLTVDANATNQRSWREHGVVANLAAMFHQAGVYGGNPGEGVVKLYGLNAQEDDRVVCSASLAGASPGVLATGWQLATGNTITFTDTNNHTDIDIVYYTPTPTSGFADATYTVDGGSPQNLVLGSANTFTKVTISGLSDGPHTVVITAGAGNFFVSHFIARRSAVNGVIVHRMGRGGATTVNLTASSSSSFTRTNQFKAQFDQNNVDAVVVMIGFNDWNTQPTNVADPTAFAANLSLLTAYVTGLGKPVLLIPDPRGSEIGSVKTYAQSAFYAAMKGLATGSVAFADPAGEMIGTYEAGNALGFYADSIHLKEVGHALLARGIYSVLTRIQQASAVAP